LASGWAGPGGRSCGVGVRRTSRVRRLALHRDRLSCRPRQPGGCGRSAVAAARAAAVSGPADTGGAQAAARVAAVSAADHHAAAHAVVAGRAPVAGTEAAARSEAGPGPTAEAGVECRTAAPCRAHAARRGPEAQEPTAQTKPLKNSGRWAGGPAAAPPSVNVGSRHLPTASARRPARLQAVRPELHEALVTLREGRTSPGTWRPPGPRTDGRGGLRSRPVPPRTHPLRPRPLPGPAGDAVKSWPRMRPRWPDRADNAVQDVLLELTRTVIVHPGPRTSWGSRWTSPVRSGSRLPGCRCAVAAAPELTPTLVPGLVHAIPWMDAPVRGQAVAQLGGLAEEHPEARPGSRSVSRR
jgi:hypothetical protein